MNKFEYGEAIVRMGGDYCAFHEVSISCEYLFGYPDYEVSDNVIEHFQENINDYIPTIKELKEDEDGYELFKGLSIEIKDKVATDWINQHDSSGNYSDYESKGVLIELDGDGFVDDVYMSI